MIHVNSRPGHFRHGGVVPPIVNTYKVLPFQARRCYSGLGAATVCHTGTTVEVMPFQAPQ